MDCVVLVGGEGTRLRPLTYNTPKQMLKVAGVTMIDRVLYYLSQNDITSVVLSLGYKPQKFVEAYPDFSAYGIRLCYAIEPEPLDTAGAIKFAADYANFNSAIVVVNGDVLTDLSILDLFKFHKESDAKATIALTPVEDPSRFGVVPTDKNGKVLAFIEKPDRDSAPTNYINAGTYILENSVLDLIETGRKVSIEREIFPKLSGEGTLFALQTDDYWLDLGTPQSLIKASSDILSNRRPDVFLERGFEMNSDGNWFSKDLLSDKFNFQGLVGNVKNSLFEGEFFFEEGFKANLSTFGVNCKIGSDSNIIESQISSDCKIGSRVVVENSIIGIGAVLKQGSCIKDSVVGDGVEVSSNEKLINQKVPT